MKRICQWCKKDTGEKSGRPLDICEECQAKLMAGLPEMGGEENGCQEQAKC